MPGPDAADHRTGPDGEGLDFRGARRLHGRAEWFWYLAAAVSYIVVSIWQKFILNWIIGPLWLVAVVVIGPAVVDRLTGRAGKATR